MESHAQWHLRCAKCLQSGQPCPQRRVSEAQIKPRRVAESTEVGCERSHHDVGHAVGTPEVVSDRLELDISGMTIGDSLRISDIVVPEGVRLLDDPESVVATVTPPTRAGAIRGTI